jgi:hypothetical protein
MTAFQNQKQIINEIPVNLFIPRLLPNVTKQFICNYFAEKRIGIVKYINAKHRLNENNYKYWFAFVSVQFYDNYYGREMYEKMIEKEDTVFMTYNKEEGKYWEISLRSQDRKRNTKKMKIKEIQEKKERRILEDGEIDEANILETNFTFYDQVEMYKDYMELEREIFGNNVAVTIIEKEYPQWGTFIPVRV